jgi:hypothetical protein
MTMKVRVLMVAIVMLAEMWLVGCGHYTCGATFGASSCTPSGGGPNQGGGGNPTGDVYLFVADAGGIQGEVLDGTAGTIKITPGFGTVSVPTNVPGDWMAVAQGKFMYTAYSSIGQIYGWSIAGSGQITFLNGGTPFPATYLVSNFQAGTQAMIANPAGTLLFALDPTLEQIHVYQIGTDGTLTEPNTSPITLPSGFKPFNLAIDGLGKYLFISNEAGLVTSEVVIYSIGSTGALAATGSPIALPLQQMQGESSGRFMVGTQGGFTSDHNIYVVDLANIQSGSIGVMPSPTLDVPVSVAVQPNTGGNLVYTFDVPNSGGNGVIEGFQLDLSTGVLGTISGSPFSVSGANGQFDQNGKFLFVVESSQGVASALDAFNVSASPTLATPPLANVGWAPGAWQAVDAP